MPLIAGPSVQKIEQPLINRLKRADQCVREKILPRSEAEWAALSNVEIEEIVKQQNEIYHSLFVGKYSLFSQIDSSICHRHFPKTPGYVFMEYDNVIIRSDEFYSSTEFKPYPEYYNSASMHNWYYTLQKSKRAGFTHIVCMSRSPADEDRMLTQVIDSDLKEMIPSKLYLSNLFPKALAIKYIQHRVSQILPIPGSRSPKVSAENIYLIDSNPTELRLAERAGFKVILATVSPQSSSRLNWAEDSFEDLGPKPVTTLRGRAESPIASRPLAPGLAEPVSFIEQLRRLTIACTTFAVRPVLPTAPVPVPVSPPQFFSMPHIPRSPHISGMDFLAPHDSPSNQNSTRLSPTSWSESPSDSDSGSDPDDDVSFRFPRNNEEVEKFLDALSNGTAQNRFPQYIVPRRAL